MVQILATVPSFQSVLISNMAAAAVMDAELKWHIPYNLGSLRMVMLICVQNLRLDISNCPDNMNFNEIYNGCRHNIALEICCATEKIWNDVMHLLVCLPNLVQIRLSLTSASDGRPRFAFAFSNRFTPTLGQEKFEPL